MIEALAELLAAREENSDYKLSEEPKTMSALQIIKQQLWFHFRLDGDRHLGSFHINLQEWSK